MMRKYKIISVLWDDHTHVSRSPMVSDPDNAIAPVLSVGILYKKTKKSLVLISDIETYEDRHDTSYTIILRSAVLFTKEYGEIELEQIREGGTI